MTYEELKAAYDAAQREIASKDEALLAANTHIDALKSEVKDMHDEIDAFASLNLTMQDIENMYGLLDECMGIGSHAMGGISLTVEQRRQLAGTSAGIRRAGFLEVIVSIIESNMQFAPKGFNLAEFKADIEMLRELRDLTMISTQFTRVTLDLQLILGSKVYRNGLDFYAGVGLAMRKPEIGALELHRRLAVFFVNRMMHRADEEDQTEAHLLRDFKALEHGRKDGEIIIRNEGDRVVKGGKVVIDTAHKDKGAFKEMEHGKID
jgi:hypothetical protein